MPICSMVSASEDVKWVLIMELIVVLARKAAVGHSLFLSTEGAALIGESTPGVGESDASGARICAVAPASSG